MRRKRVPWLENGASRSASRYQRPSDPGSPRVLSSALSPRPGHPLPLQPGTDLPPPAPAQDQAMPFLQNHHPPEASQHHPRGGSGGRRRQKRAHWGLRTRTTVRAEPLRRRSQLPQLHQRPHQRPHPAQPSLRRSNPLHRSLQTPLSRLSRLLRLHLLPLLPR